MRAAVQHVQHRRGQHAGVHAAQIAVQRNLKRLRHGARRGHGNGKNGVGAQLALVRRAVQRNHRLVDQPLVGRVHAFQLRRNHGFNVFHGLQHALAEVMALVAVAQFHGLMLAGRSARRHNGAAHGAAFQNHVRFHGRIAARVKNFAGTYGNNLSHIAPHNAVLQPVIQLEVIGDGDPRQEHLRRRFEWCSKAPACAKNPPFAQPEKCVKKNLRSLRILANRAYTAPVAAATPSKNCAGESRRVTVLILDAFGTHNRRGKPALPVAALRLSWVS